MLLWVVRHAIAISREDPASPADPERALTERGRWRMEEAARGLANLEVAPDRILSSPYVRARQTAEIVAEVLEFPGSIECSESLEPGEDPAEIVREIVLARVPTMVCGHAPHVDRLIAHLVGSTHGFTSLKKGGTAQLELSGSATGVPALLDWLLPPRALRRVGE